LGDRGVDGSERNVAWACGLD